MESLELNIPCKDVLKAILELVNPHIGNLTFQEMEILRITLSKDITELTPDNRALIRKESNLEKFNFNNYIKKLKDKKVLISKDNSIFVNPMIIKISKYKSLNITYYAK